MGVGRYRWQSGVYDLDVPSDSERTVRDEIENAILQVQHARFNNPNRPAGVTSLEIDNSLCQAAIESCARWQGRAERGEDDFAVGLRYRFHGTGAQRIWAEGSASVKELCDALVKDPATVAVIDDPRWGVIGAGIGGSQYNLRVEIVFGERDPRATRDEPNPLQQVPLRDGLGYGDVHVHTITTGVG